MNTKKYRVLAADDEYWSRENIRNLIPWEEYAMEFLEPACDGEEVLERIPDENPHILLTDINMPFLSGLELLDRLKTEYPHLITIAVSGYDDFDKVKGVFMSGGIDYLLKPVSKEDLVNVLSKALNILEDREAARFQEQNSKIQECKISSFLEDSEYSALLSEKLYKHSSVSPHVADTETFSHIRTALVKFYDITEIAAGLEHDIVQMSYTIKSQLKKLFPADIPVILFNNSNKMSEFLVISPGEEELFMDFACKVKDAFPLSQYGPVSIVLHNRPSSLDDIGTVYREIIAAIVMRPFCREHCILKYPGKSGSASQAFSDKLSTRFEDELYHLLITRQRSQASRLIFKICDFLRSSEGRLSFLEVKQYIGRVTNILYRYVQEYSPELIRQTEDTLDNIDYYMKCLYTEPVISSISIILNSLWNTSQTGSSDTAVKLAEQVHKYIEHAYYENITLTALAEEYHIDASYLSRIFSQKYNETIIAFLTRTRLEHAVQLMEDSDKKLETISFLVGYDDYNYFSRVFRKKLGKSPSEYRNQLLKGTAANQSK